MSCIHCDNRINILNIVFAMAVTCSHIYTANSFSDFSRHIATSHFELFSLTDIAPRTVVTRANTHTHHVVAFA